VNTYSQVVKSVVASAVNEEGEQLFPRKWNHEFVDMPVVDKSKQNTPHFTSEVIAGFSSGDSDEIDHGFRGHLDHSFRGHADQDRSEATLAFVILEK
jgi:hypothetical protein